MPYTKMVFVKFALIFLLIGEGSAKVNPHGPTVVNDLASCVTNVIEINFKRPGILVFANTNNFSTSVSRIRSQLLSYLHEDIKYSIEITSPDGQETICGENNEYDIGVLHRDHFEPVIEADYYVLIIDDYKDFTGLASKIIRSRRWNSRAKFIVLLLNFARIQTNVNYVERIITCLYNFYVLDIIIILPHESNIRNALIYGWRAYEPPKYCGYFNETAKDRSILINTCEKGRLKNNVSVFPDQIPKSMKGCILHILALKREPFVSGNENEFNMEEYLVNEVFKTFHFTVEYDVIHSFRGERYDGEWNGALKLLSNKRGHILLGGIFPDFDVHEDFESSTFYLSDSYTWVVPRAPASPRWVALFIIFSNFVWLCVCITFLICVMSWIFLGFLSRDTSYNRYFGHCFLNSWACTLGFCSYIRPKKESLRLFYVFFNLYCILNLTAYQTKLIDVLRNPTFEYQIKTIEELLSSGLSFGGAEDLHDLFYNSSDSFDNLIGERWVDVDDIRIALIDVTVHRNFSLLCSRLELTHMSAIMPELSDSFGNLKYYVFDQSMFTVPNEMVARRGFPFMQDISQRLSALRQSGANAGVRRLFKSFNARRRAKLLRSITSTSKSNGLSIQHLQGGFLALALGYVSGTFVLFVEVVYSSKILNAKILEWRRKISKIM
ncbi:uncharacterized protein LOC128675743 [Plodia interpunctella]|uniref:uncharacterized protein LOC128675743 n=1 Tax=Plodia interpunctella TaxID=58824 RepID=UPI002368D293|nr:uncharacterized protein LOC128675743 [Plodia interpunctella]